MLVASTTVPLVNGLGKVCQRSNGGSAILSNRQYYTGEFEFKLLPSMAPGIVTVIGIADDGQRPILGSHFVQLAFDVNRYGNTSFAVQLGTFKSDVGAETREYVVNMSDIDYFKTNGIDSLNSTALIYKIKRVNTTESITSSGGQIEVHVSTDQDSENLVQNYEKVFSTAETPNDLTLFVRGFPFRFNVHAATWYNNLSSSDNDTSTYQIQSSSISMFKYTNIFGQVEAEDYFGSETMDLFSPITSIYPPTWANDTNLGSTLLSSNVQYIQGLDNEAGSIRLNTMMGILPLDNSSWYLGYVHDNEILDVKIMSTTQLSNDYQVTVPLGHLVEDNGQMLLVALDSTPSSAIYKLDVCGAFQNSANVALTSWPVEVTLMQFNQSPFSSISTRATFNLTTTPTCYQVSLKVSVNDSNSILQDLNDYASLVLDFSPILKSHGFTTDLLGADTQAIFSSFQLTTSCIDESPFSYPPSGDPEKPPPIIVDRYVTKEVATDGDEKQTYSAAVTVWAVFLVVLIIIAVIVLFLVRSYRATLGKEHAQLQELEKKVAEKRSELGEHQLLIEKRGITYRQQDNNHHGPVAGPGNTESALRAAENNEDDLQAIYDIDGAIKTFNRGGKNFEAESSMANSMHHESNTHIQNRTSTAPAGGALGLSGIDVSMRSGKVNVSTSLARNQPQVAGTPSQSALDHSRKSANSRHNLHPEHVAEEVNEDDGIKSERRSIPDEDDFDESSVPHSKEPINNEDDFAKEIVGRRRAQREPQLPVESPDAQNYDSLLGKKKPKQQKDLAPSALLEDASGNLRGPQHKESKTRQSAARPEEDEEYEYEEY